MSDVAHRFAVEHSHRLMLGSCRGELPVGFCDVEFQTASGVHGFKVPFGRLSLAVAGRSVMLGYASDGKPFQTLKALDANQAQRLKQAWDRFNAMER